MSALPIGPALEQEDGAAAGTGGQRRSAQHQGQQPGDPDGREEPLLSGPAGRIVNADWLACLRAFSFFSAAEGAWAAPPGGIGSTGRDLRF
jgi:hypothetical protein